MFNNIQEFHNLLIVCAIYVGIFALAETWRVVSQPAVEKTRKMVHLLSGFVCLFFGFLFQSHWTILLLGFSFSLIMILSKKYNLLNSIHGVSRQSQGGIYFPFAVWLTFLICEKTQHMEFYFIGILVLSLADSFAALAGKAYGRIKIRVEDDQKTLLGSIVFFITAFACILVSMFVLTDLPKYETLLASLYVAILVTVFEFLALQGSDNVFIPLGTVAVLLKITEKPLEEMFYQIVLIFAIFIVTYVILRKIKWIGFSAVIGIALFAYATQALIDISWSYVVFIIIIFISYAMKGNDEITEKYRVRPLFYFILVSIAWMMAGNYFPDYRGYFFTPFAVSLIVGSCILWKNNINDLNIKLFKFKNSSIIELFMISFLSVLFLLTPHKFFESDFNWFYSALSGLISVFIILVIRHYYLEDIIGLKKKMIVQSTVTAVITSILAYSNYVFIKG